MVKLPAKVNDTRPIETTNFRFICGKIVDCFYGISSKSYTYLPTISRTIAPIHNLNHILYIAILTRL